MEEAEETMDRDAGPVPPGCNIEELRPDTEEFVFPPGCVDVEGEEDNPKEDTDPPGFVDAKGEEDDPKEDADPPVRVALDAEETCTVENGSKVTVSVLLA